MPAQTTPVDLVIQLGHACEVTSVAVSPDGVLLLSGSEDNAAILWDIASGRELRRLRHPHLVSAVAFAPDGKSVLTGCEDMTARLWQPITGNESRKFTGHAGSITAVAFVNARRVLTGSTDKTARLWDADSGKELLCLRGHSDAVVAVAVSTDSKRIVTGSLDGTARLWDADSGRLIASCRSGFEGVTAVAISPSGSHVLTGGEDRTVRLWETALSTEVRTFHGHDAMITSVAFAPDGSRILTSAWDRTARLWDAETGLKLKTFTGRHGRLNQDLQKVRSKDVPLLDAAEIPRGQPTKPGKPKGAKLFNGEQRVNAVAFAAGGRQVVTAAGDQTVRLWDADSGAEIRRFQGMGLEVMAVAFGPDGKSFACGGRDAALQLWDAPLGREVRRFPGAGGLLTALAFSSDGKRLATGGLLALVDRGVAGKSGRSNVQLWDAVSGAPLHDLLGHVQRVTAVAFSADRNRVLAAGWDTTARCWDVATGQAIQVLRGHRDKVAAAVFTPDGHGALTGGWDRTALLWDVSSGKVLRKFDGHTERINAVAISPDGRRALTAGADTTARIWDLATGKQLQVFNGHTQEILAAAFSPDGKLVLTGSWDQTARLWDADTGRELHRLPGHGDLVSAVAFSPDGKRLVTGSWDQTAIFWNAETGKELCRLVSFVDGSWAVVDPTGRFDASNSGDVEGLHWVVGLEPIALKQLKDRYYEPGLLAKYLGFNKQSLRSVAALEDANVKLFPAVDTKAPVANDGKLVLKLRNQGGGIGKVQVLVNDREVFGDARGAKPNPDATHAEFTVDLSGAQVLPGEENQVRIITWNKEGYLSSRGMVFKWLPHGKKDERPPELHAIVVGVSAYAASPLKLRYAAKDAADFAKALTLASKRLFGAGKVHLALLCDAEGVNAIPPTSANLEKAFAAARNSKPGDILVVYLAGHGISLRQKDQELYCYLTQEANSTDRNAFADPAVLKQNAVTSTQLTDWFKQIPALKQVLILDTCAAGAAANKLMEHRDTDADSIRAIDRLRDRTGFHVLMGCAADKVSYESSQYAQGLLTYSLLEAMKGAKLRKDEFVDVSELFQYAADRVPQLNQGIGGVQRPMIMAPRGTSFDVGRLLAEDKALVPLASVRPLLLRPVLQNADENVLDDDLGLMPALRRKLSEDSYAASRGTNATDAVYVDADEMPGAVRPAGKYTLKGQAVHVRMLLRRDGKTVATIEVEGTRDQLPRLVNQLAKAIEEKLQAP